jgi:hypothetical protein
LDNLITKRFPIIKFLNQNGNKQATVYSFRFLYGRKIQVGIERREAVAGVKQRATSKIEYWAERKGLATVEPFLNCGADGRTAGGFNVFLHAALVPSMDLSATGVT